MILPSIDILVDVVLYDGIVGTSNLNAQGKDSIIYRVFTYYDHSFSSK